MFDSVTTSDTALAALRVATGFFFAGSGFHKLFTPTTRAKIDRLFAGLNLPRPTLQARLVSWGEFLGGLGLMAGVLVIPAALGLIVILAGAIKLVAWEEVRAKHPVDWADWCVKALYMPEGLLCLVLAVLAIAGAGPLSGEALFLAAYRGDL